MSHVPHSWMWHDSFIFWTLLNCVRTSKFGHYSCVHIFWTLLVRTQLCAAHNLCARMCVIPHSYARHGAFICGTWFVHIYSRDDLFKYYEYCRQSSSSNVSCRLLRVLAYTLQHAATRCNTLQHTATYCNTRQHAANTLQHPATQTTCCDSTLFPSHLSDLTHITTHCKYCNTLQTLCNHSASRCNTQHHPADSHNLLRLVRFFFSPRVPATEAASGLSILPGERSLGESWP